LLIFVGDWPQELGCLIRSKRMQIFYTDRLVRIEDWSALMDTSTAVAMVSALFLVVTIVLNAAAFIVYYGKKSKDH